MSDKAQDHGVNPAVVAAAGVVVGAAAVVAGVVAAADKGNQEKVQEVMTKVSNQVEDAKDKVAEVATDAIGAVHHAAKAAQKEVNKI